MVCFIAHGYSVTGFWGRWHAQRCFAMTWQLTGPAMCVLLGGLPPPSFTHACRNQASGSLCTILGVWQGSSGGTAPSEASKPSTRRSSSGVFAACLDHEAGMDCELRPMCTGAATLKQKGESGCDCHVCLWVSCLCLRFFWSEIGDECVAFCEVVTSAYCRAACTLSLIHISEPTRPY